MSIQIQGLSFPLELDGKGNLKISTDVELIADHIVHKLLVTVGENPMRPSYGVPDLLFNSNSGFDEYSADVQRRLTREIPQANFRVSGQLGDEGEALLTVEWTYQSVDQEPLELRIN